MHPGGSETRRARAKTGLRAIALGLSVMGLGWLSSRFVFPPEHNAVVWIPGGLTLAVLVRARRSNWPAYLAATCLGYVLLEVLRGTPWGVNLLWAVGDTLGAYVGGVVMRHWADSTLAFNRTRDVAVLLAASLLSPLPSSLLGAVGVSLLGYSTTSFGLEFAYWAIGDALGAMLVTPLVLAWVEGDGRLSLPPHPGELAVALALLAVLSQLIFSSQPPMGLLLAPPYACIPLLVWAALRAGPRGATAASLVMGALAVWHTTAGRGPFGSMDFSIQVRMFSVQAFLAIMSLSGLTLAALVCERHRAEQAQRLLSQAGTLLAESLDYRATLPRIAHLLVPHVVSGFGVWLAGEDGHLKRVTQAGLAPSGEQRLREALREQQVPTQVWMGPKAGTAVLVRLQRRERVLGGLALVLAWRSRPVDALERAFAEDLAHRCTLALENARLFEEANEAVHVRDEFLGIAAHELRTPVTALRLHLQGLARLLGRLTESSEALRKLHLVARQVGRMAQLVERLLDVGRINTGRLELEREAVDLTELIDQVADRLAEDLERSGCTLSVRVRAHPTGWWDRSRLEQALSILLSNAMKFGAERPIELEVDEAEGRACITVTDHGLGISREALARIFDRFERAVSSSEYGGLGLGLFVAREIAEAHGGSIHAASAPGKGSTFTLELPATHLPGLLHEPSSQPAAP